MIDTINELDHTFLISYDSSLAFAWCTVAFEEVLLYSLDAKWVCYSAFQRGVSVALYQTLEKN